MEQKLSSRLKNAWNAFRNRDPTGTTVDFVSYVARPDRPRLNRGNERSIVTVLFNRIAIDAAAIEIRHCQLDENGKYKSKIESSLNNCLGLEANTDQTGRALLQDIVMSLLDEGSVAIIPTDVDINDKTGKLDILKLRTGRIIQWYPKHVKVNAYNEETGRREDIILPKDRVAIVENPLYAIINEPNSTIKRLSRKLNLLDMTDEQTASGKLDMIIQLPYQIRTEARRQQAEKRRSDIEQQLTSSRYGIAYTDGTEKIVQLNRSVENNLMSQVEYLTNMAYSQLGITQSILDGTCDEQTMLNYNNRTIEPIVSAIVDEMRRKFLTDSSRKNGETIMCFKDPFKLVPVANIAEIADKFTRNEILSSNEIRQIIGFLPSDDPKADELNNSNISHAKEESKKTPPVEQQPEETNKKEVLTDERV